MSLIRVEYLRNWDIFTRFEVFQCDECFREIPENYPRVNVGTNRHLCCECGFKKGCIQEQDFLNFNGVCLSNAHASIRHGEVVIWVGERAPWEKSKQDLRRTSAYQKWRKSVFERDRYTCQVCGQVGGRLNAHHIKLFSKYPQLRLKLSNGLTLCESCHRNIHRKKVVTNEGSISNKQRNI